MKVGVGVKIYIYRLGVGARDGTNVKLGISVSNGAMIGVGIRVEQGSGAGRN